jgi:flagellar biosynthesis protein
MGSDQKPIKRPKAVALRYAEDDQAPRIVATGVGEIARRILQLARENNIPIKQNDDLVDILERLDIGYEIPPETYRAVAEILAFLYRTDAEWRKRKEDVLLNKGIALEDRSEEPSRIEHSDKD